jgi:hypothetical protein
LSGVKCHFRISEEESRLARRFAAMSRHGGGRAVQAITSVKFANSVVTQSGELTDREGAGFVVYQAQRQVQTLPISRVSII